MTASPCPICSGPTLAATPVERVTGTEGLGWENDSALEILGWQEAQTQLRLCPACLHARLLPEFDASRLYGERAAQLRREVLARYPDPGRQPHSLGDGLRRAGLEASRLNRIMDLAVRSLGASEPLKEIRVLDWGGGDGYLGETIAGLVGAATNRPALSVVYEYTDWEDPTTRRIGLKNLETQPPFQLLILSHVLEHSHDPAGTLGSALRFLGPGGLAVCEVPDERGTFARRALRRRRGLDFHVGYFTRRSLHRLLAACGLGAVRTAYLASSYRGEPIRSVLGVALKGPGPGARVPCRLGEAWALAVHVARKAAGVG